MSDSEGYKAVTVSDHGLTVTKRFEQEEFPVPAIAFDFSSERDEMTQVTLRDSVPDGVEVEDLGFHPEYGSEYWSINENEITFERDLAANSDYTTVYGIRATGIDDIKRFLDKPEITSVDPPRSDPSDESTSTSTNLSPPQDQGTVRDAIPEETDDVHNSVHEEEGNDEDVETLELDDPDDRPGNEHGRTESAPDKTETEASSPPSTDNSLLSELAVELRENNVPTEDVELFREKLAKVDKPDGSITARVDRIQHDISDLRAYTDALEEFLDENGTAEEVVEEFRSDIETLEETIGNIESTVAVHGDSLQSIEEDMSSIESNMANIESEFDMIKAKLGDESLAQRVEELESELNDIQTWQAQIKETFGSG